MPRCRGSCKTRFKEIIDFINHSKEECERISSEQPDRDTHLFRQVVSELKSKSNDECIACGRLDDQEHTTRCVAARAERRAKRTSYIRKTDDTKLLKQVRELLINESGGCTVCGGPENKYRDAIIHEPGCIHVQVTNRIVRFQ
ncbi:MAG: hypothetical protein R3346_02255 [Candidatus Spechtbacterales bacterium]|nr:hypothetical protein [Candidatus Spechtbacterales bacterium]